jgi:nuclear GTP-binding protein
MFLINKADFILVWALKKWVQYLSKDYPTIAYSASITNSFRKGSLINLFRRFHIFHRDKINISIELAGYPNVGKSSIINSLLCTNSRMN